MESEDYGRRSLPRLAGRIVVVETPEPRTERDQRPAVRLSGRPVVPQDQDEVRKRRWVGVEVAVPDEACLEIGADEGPAPITPDAFPLSLDLGQIFLDDTPDSFLAHEQPGVVVHRFYRV